MRFFPILFTFLLATPCLLAQDLVSKPFLIQLNHFLQLNPSYAHEINFAETEAEKTFVSQLQTSNLSMLYAATKPYDQDIFDYNFLHVRRRPQISSDQTHLKSSNCKTVYADKNNINLTTLPFLSLKPHPAVDIADVNVGWLFSYCVGEDKDSDPNTVLYYFHGASGSPANWMDRESTSEIRRLWREKGKLPRWVSISFGRLGTLMEKDVLEKFINVIVPHIETTEWHITDPSKIKRIGMGVSMGGANVTQIVLRQRDFFNSVFLVCPAISSTDVTDAQNRFDLIHRTNAINLVLRIAGSIMPKYLFDKEYADSIDPLLLGQTVLSPKSPRMYIQTSHDDQFGLNEGGRIFALLAMKRGVDLRFEEIEGRHCVLRPKSIVDFFLGAI
jgi:hypothetical protein